MMVLPQSQTTPVAAPIAQLRVQAPSPMPAAKLHARTRRASCYLTFDMRRGAKGAKRPLGRRLDGRVRRRAHCWYACQCPGRDPSLLLSLIDRVRGFGKISICEAAAGNADLLGQNRYEPEARGAAGCTKVAFLVLVLRRVVKRIDIRTARATNDGGSVEVGRDTERAASSALAVRAGQTPCMVGGAFTVMEALPQAHVAVIGGPSSYEAAALRGLTFDMSGGTKAAKRLKARPLDGRVRLPRTADGKRTEMRGRPA